MEDRIRKQWETNSEAFADLIGGVGTPHHIHILNPCVENLLGEVTGKRLLDAGCGEGYLAREYAKRGAIVTAVDISADLIAVARKKSKEEGIVVEYEVADVCLLDWIPDNEFDIVLSNLVLLNVPCLDVLRQQGCLVLSIVHPAFDFYGPGAWEMGGKDSATGRREGKYFKIDQYFNERKYERYWTTRNGERFPAPISFFHRTLATYLNSLSTAGLRLADFREPQPAVGDKFFDRERRIPFFAVFKAIKD
jgi:SAM-dependent methyltransferase